MRLAVGCTPGQACATFARWMHGWSLRFKEPATERAYVESRMPQLVTNLSRFLKFLIGQSLYLILIDTFPLPDTDERGAEVVFIRLGLQALGLCVFFGAWVFIVTSGFKRCLTWVGREYFVLILATVGLALTSSCNWYHLATACGYDDPKTLQATGIIKVGPFTDTGLVLIIDVGVTFTHILLPIRCEILLLFDLAAILVFVAFAFGLGSPESENLLQTTVLFVSLILGAALGKRNMEKHERAYFLGSLREKQERAELEFQLAQSSTAAANLAEESSRSEGDSSGGLFSRAVPQELHRVAALGAKEHWLLPNDALEIAPEEILGQGGFGIVAAGSLHGTPVAVKVPKRSAEDASVRNFAQHANELRILRRLRNTHIVQFHGACIDLERGNLALVEELMEGPSLLGFLRGRGVGPGGDTPDDAARHCLALGVCCGLRYLHAHDPRIVHGDLKPDNIRVEQLNGRPLAKLIDFGLSQLIGSTPKPLGGSLSWMAPEVMLNQLQRTAVVPPDPAADVYSFGRVLYTIALGATPDCEPLALLTAAKQGRSLPLQWPDNPSPLAALCARVAERCLTHDPEARPKIEGLQESLRFQPRGEGPRAAGDMGPPSAEGAALPPRSGHVPWCAGVQQVHAAVSQPQAAGS